MMKDSSRASDLEIEYQDKRIKIDLDPWEWMIVGFLAIVITWILRS